MELAPLASKAHHAAAGNGACTGCGERDAESRFDLPIAMAFQPIVDASGRVFAQEALVRGACVVARHRP